MYCETWICPNTQWHYYFRKGRVKMHCSRRYVPIPLVRSKAFQGHPRSKVILLTERPREVCYPTSSKSNIVSLTIFEIFDLHMLWHRSSTAQDHLGSKFMVQQPKAICRFLGRLSLSLTLYRYIYLWALSRHFVIKLFFHEGNGKN